MMKEEDREDRKEKMSPECDITPLLGSKLPQLRLSCLPVYEVVDVSIMIVGCIYLFRGGATMFAKEEEGASLSAGATVLIGGALEFFMARVMSETLATPLRH